MIKLNEITEYNFECLFMRIPKKIVDSNQMFQSFKILSTPCLTFLFLNHFNVTNAHQCITKKYQMKI